MNAHLVISVLLCTATCETEQLRVWDGDSFLVGMQSGSERIRVQNIDAPEIEFFSEHYVADADHSSRQIDLVRRLVTNEDLQRRALEVAETAVKTRWACMNEISRTAVLGERDPVPAGVAA